MRPIGLAATHRAFLARARARTGPPPRRRTARLAERRDHRCHECKNADERGESGNRFVRKCHKGVTVAAATRLRHVGRKAQLRRAIARRLCARRRNRSRSQAPRDRAVGHCAHREVRGFGDERNEVAKAVVGRRRNRRSPLQYRTLWQTRISPTVSADRREPATVENLTGTGVFRDGSQRNLAWVRAIANDGLESSRARRPRVRAQRARGIRSHATANAGTQGARSNASQPRRVWRYAAHRRAIAILRQTSTASAQSTSRRILQR